MEGLDVLDLGLHAEIIADIDSNVNMTCYRPGPCGVYTPPRVRAAPPPPASKSEMGPRASRPKDAVLEAGRRLLVLEHALRVALA